MIINGSGRCFWAKNTLCLRDSIRLAGFRKRRRLRASALVRKKALVPGAQTAGSWGWDL
jgi:hypothetical protein